VREAKVADIMAASVAVAMSKRVYPKKSWTSFNSNGVDSEGLMAYSPGLRRKKKARHIMSATHCR